MKTKYFLLIILGMLLLTGCTLKKNVTPKEENQAVNEESTKNIEGMTLEEIEGELTNMDDLNVENDFEQIDQEL